MAGAIRNVLALVLTLERDRGALEAAEHLAREQQARVTALFLAMHPASDFAEPIAPFSLVLEDVARGPKGEAARHLAEVQSWIAERGSGCELRVLPLAEACGAALLTRARRAHLIVMTRPLLDGDLAHRVLCEDLLFRAHRPLLLVPPGWQPGSLGRRILIAWNGKREVRRALAGALPFVTMAEAVVVATVDAPGLEEDGERPGHRLAQHLCQLGAHARAENLDGLGRSTATRLLEAAQAMEADLIVMGGYGHARAAERILGGVTRDMLEHSSMPILMTH